MSTATRSTPAEIRAEAIAAHQTEYEPLLSLEAIHPHPKNIRHDARADDELVDSIASQGLLEPLLVAPHPDGTEGKYILIAGHRRKDGLERALFTHAPALIRYDLVDEADQVAAMLVENGRRADLTPLEEAEGFDLLSELGWKPDEISTATGRSTSLIKQRRKLTTLRPAARGAVDGHQITIDDALALAALPDQEQKELERHIPTGSFRYELKSAQQRAERRVEVEKARKQYAAAGVPELEMPANSSIWTLTHADHGMVRLGLTFSTDPADHDGCLAFVNDGTRQYPSLELVCTDPGRHDDQLSDAQRAAKAEDDRFQAEREQEAQARRERDEARRIARQLRVDALVAAIKPKAKVDPMLEQLLRLGLVALLDRGELARSAEFHELANVPEALRWAPHHRVSTEYLRAVATMTTAQLVRAIAALLLDDVETVLEVAGEVYSEVTDVDRILAQGYLVALADAGHELNDVDHQILDPILRAEEDEGAAS